MACALAVGVRTFADQASLQLLPLHCVAHRAAVQSSVACTHKCLHSAERVPQLFGYYAGALTVDIKPWGRRRMTIFSFCMVRLTRSIHLHTPTAFGSGQSSSSHWQQAVAVDPIQLLVKCLLQTA